MYRISKLVVLITLYLFTSNAGAADLELYGQWNTHNTSMYAGAKVIVKSDRGVYGALSVTQDELFYNLPGPAFNTYSATLGYRHQIVEHVSLYGEAGIFWPDGNMRVDDDFVNSEVLYMIINDAYRDTYKFMTPDANKPSLMPQRYELEVDPAFGVEFGVHGSWPLTKRFNANAMFGYQYLKLPYKVSGKWYDFDKGHLEYFGNHDASTFKAYLGVSWGF